jgi:hypothetical protein
MTKLRILHHDHCFDGFASASVFARFYAESVKPGAEIRYTGLAHKPNQKLIEEELFDGDENAIVDFKYSPSAKLTWWFDHHQSAFLSEEDESHFRNNTWRTKFYNPNYKSCTKFIADILTEQFRFKAPDLGELIHWADVIDGAQYESARVAVELDAPALKLMLVIEASRDRKVMDRILAGMNSGNLNEIITDPIVSAVFQPLFERHRQMIDIIAKEGRFDRDVLHFDLSKYDAEGYSKFIPYYLFPDCVYSVGVSMSPTRSKVSVGFNPWSPRPRAHNLASICERYNGGGHAVVGAISYRPDQIELARETALAIVEELRS